MRSFMICCAAATPFLAPDFGGASGAQAGERMLAHNVYFTLKDDSNEAKKQLVAGIRRDTHIMPLGRQRPECPLCLWR